MRRDTKRWKEKLRQDSKKWNEKFRSDARESTEALRRDTEKWKDEARLFFSVALERLEDAVKMINIEKIKDHDDRIIQLEVATGIRE